MDRKLRKWDERKRKINFDWKWLFPIELYGEQSIADSDQGLGEGFKEFRVARLSRTLITNQFFKSEASTDPKNACKQLELSLKLLSITDKETLPSSDIDWKLLTEKFDFQLLPYPFSRNPSFSLSSSAILPAKIKVFLLYNFSAAASFNCWHTEWNLEELESIEFTRKTLK